MLGDTNLYDPTEPRPHHDRSDAIDSELNDPAILDFWHWAFGDLRDDLTRDAFGEWLVARLLDIDPPPARVAQGYDLISADGVKIEVKTAVFGVHPPDSAAWPRRAPRRPLWCTESGHRRGLRYTADLYIYCVQPTTTPPFDSPLDARHWQFYIVHHELIEGLNPDRLRLDDLEELASPLSAAPFRRRGRELIWRIDSLRHARELVQA